MTIFCLDSIIDGMQLVMRGINVAMDTNSPDDLNPEDNGKIEEFAHAYMTRSEPGFKMFVQTTFVFVKNMFLEKKKKKQNCPKFGRGLQGAEPPGN